MNLYSTRKRCFQIQIWGSPNPLVIERNKIMSNFLFFLLGLIIGGLSGITLMCMCIISQKADSKISVYEKNKAEEHSINKR